MSRREYRPGLPALPENMKGLPTVRGYPVPWFVEWINGEPEFRATSREKINIAIKKSLCWVCGKRRSLTESFAFVIGPMCAINRTSSEPPSHIECALYSVEACPFLSRPQMERRTDRLPEDRSEAAGVMLKRNPGVALVWITTSFVPVPAHNGFLLKVGRPSEVLAFCEGRKATADELRESIESGLPILRDAAEKSDGLAGLAQIAAQKREAYKILGLM